MGNFFAELRRRHVYRVGAAYAVIAWLLLQLFNNVTPILEAPAWVGRVLLLLLVVGFPIALILAWTFEATLARIKRETPALAGAVNKTPTTMLDYVLAGALVVVIGLVSYQELASLRGVSVRRQTEAISIAVLPFANVSGDASQEFFSDGMTDEIMTALAKVKGLTVLARTSVFEYKGQNRNARDIGQALGAAYLVEGSVRKAGDQVRITAQLVRAENGASLWTESYDRELKNIFATQSDIAQAIAGALRVPLGINPGESLVANRTADLDSYEQFLRAKSLYRARSVEQSISILENVVARDPEYAPAWALLSLAYLLSPGFDGTTKGDGPVEQARRVIEESQSKAELAGRRAIQLDPKSATSYGALASLTFVRGKWVEADDLFQQSQMLDANNPDVLDRYMSMLNASGRFRASLAVREKLHKLEPLEPTYQIRYAAAVVRSGQLAAGIALLESIPHGSDIYGRNVVLAEAYAVAGRFAEAADTLLAIRPGELSRESVEAAASLLRQGPTKTNAPEKLPVLEGPLAFVYLYAGAPERLLDGPERRFDIGFRTFDQAVWDPKYASVHKNERFRTLVRKVGLVDFWKARGWPDLCHPVGADDFACD